MNGSVDNPCDKTKRLLELRMDEGALAADEMADLEARRKSCQPCAHWQRQVQDIVAAARATAQFDVSEALTQRILSAVEHERHWKAASAAQVGSMLVLLAAGAGVFVVDSMESLSGLGSWCVGLAVMFVIQTIVAGGQPGNQAGGRRL